MKEHGSYFSQSELQSSPSLGLTLEGRNAYASSGEKSMPEGTSGTIDATTRPWDPIDSEIQSDTPQLREVAESLRGPIREAHIREFQNREGRPPTPTELQTINYMARFGLMPQPMVDTGPTSGGAPVNPEDLNNLVVETPGRRTASPMDDEEFREAFRTPKNLNDIAEAIGRSFPGFGENEAFAIVENGKVNDANFLRWIRSRIMFFEGEEGPDTPITYEQVVVIPYGNSFLNMSNLLRNDQRYFRDSDNNFHNELAQQIRREFFARQTIRSRDISYRRDGKGMGDDEGLAGVMSGLFKNSTMTRSELWDGKSLWYWTMEAPFDFINEFEVPSEERENELWRSKRQDTRLGRATATALMAYYHISDFEKLQEMLGKNSSIFTREGFERARLALAKEDIPSNSHLGSTTEEVANKLKEQFISSKDLDKLFSGGEINKTELVNFLNFFPQAQVNSLQRRMVRKLIQQAIGEKYRLYRMHKQKDEDTGVEETVKVDDKDMMSYAESQAFLMTRWTGAAARNDWGAAAYDAQSKILHTQTYRHKQADPKRGGAFGNIYNVGLFKQLGLNYLDAMVSTQKGPDGKPLTLREVLENIARVDVVSDEESKEALQKERDSAQQALSGLVFNDSAESNLSNNGINRWFAEYDSFVGAKELHLGKVVEHAKLRGVVYDPAEFGKMVQDGFIKPLRYGYSTFEIQYDKTIRDLVEFNPDNPDHKGKATIKQGNKSMVFADTSIAEMMYGNQLLDISAFWFGKPKLDDEGNQVKDSHGNVVFEKYYEHVIDPSRIATSAGRTQMIKQMALGRVAADIYSHRDRNSPYQHWDLATTEALIEALATIPGEVLVDEHDLKNTVVGHKFFSEEDIKYLKYIAKVTFKDIAKRDLSMAVGKSALSTGKNFIKAFFKQLK